MNLSESSTRQFKGSGTRIKRLALTLAITGLVVAACDTKNDFLVDPMVTLSISPSPATMVVTGTQQFTASGKDTNGASAVVPPATWSVVAGGGTISSTGLFTAGPTAGTFTSTIKATSAGMTALSTVTITAGPIASIVV